MNTQDELPPGFTQRLSIKLAGYDPGDISWSSDGRFLAVQTSETAIDIWNIQSKQKHDTIKLVKSIPCFSWIPNKSILAYIDSDTVLFRDIEAKKNLQSNILAAPAIPSSFSNLAWSPVNDMFVAGSGDGFLNLWLWDHKLQAYSFVRYLNFPRNGDRSIQLIVWSPDGQTIAAFGPSSYIVCIWSISSGNCLQMFSGHTDEIHDLAWFPGSEQLLASCSGDRTIRIWRKNAEPYVLESHTSSIHSLSFSYDGRILASISSRGAIHLQRTDTWTRVAVLNEQEKRPDELPDWLTEILRTQKVPKKIVFHPYAPILAARTSEGEITIWDLDTNALLQETPKTSSIHYTSAKVVLVGDSAAGKSGLSLALTRQPFVPTDSTHSRHVWLFDKTEVENEYRIKEEREILLWDLAGQPDYRLIHQLHLGQATVALLVFDASRETETFSTVRYWNRALHQAQSTGNSTAHSLKKFLVAARLDRGSVNVSRDHVRDLVYELGCAGYFGTSAKEGWNIEKLAQTIHTAIDWDALPKVISTELFQRIKQFLFQKKETGNFLHTVNELYYTFLQEKDIPPASEDLQAQFETCLGHIEAGGLIRRLSFGNLVLLQPELLDTYASGLLITVKGEAEGLGTIAEERVRQGDFFIPSEDRLKKAEDEKLLLIAMVEELLQHELALREGGNLIFPSQFSLDTTDLSDPRGKAVSITFSGPILNTYTILVVRLSHSKIFKKQKLWKNAATYTTARGGIYGIYLDRTIEEQANLILFFDPSTTDDMRILFEEYIFEHIQQHAPLDSIHRKRLFSCPTCGISFTDEQIETRYMRGFNWISCPCDARVSLIDRDRNTAPDPAPRIAEMHTAADNQREREAAKSQLEGKIATQDFDVYLCYNPTDRAEVKKVARQLKEWGILPWLDEWELQPGRPQQHAVEKQIEQIRIAAVFIGREGVGPWERIEMDALLREFVQRRCPVIPVILENATHEPQLPTFLKTFTTVDFRKDDPHPLEQLVWGITGKRITTQSLSTTD